MKTLLIALMCLVPLWSTAQSQGQRGDRRFDPKKFQEMKEQSLTKAASLTMEEAKAFFPLYNEMRAKQRDMGRQIHNLKKNAHGDAKSLPSTIMRIKQLQVEMAELERNCFEHILKVVPPEKVLKVIEAEDDFHRRMVQGQRGPRPNHKPGERQGGGPR